MENFTLVQPHFFEILNLQLEMQIFRTKGMVHHVKF